jgi:predicted MFS family arabinose efflux permease
MQSKQLKPTYTTFAFLLVAIVLWSLYSGGIEFLLKNLAAGPLEADPALLLEQILAAMSVGGIIAYAIGGSLSSVFSKRSLIISGALISVLFMLVEYYVGLGSHIMLFVTTVALGILYSLFAVVRTIITSIEMRKTQMPDTTVNGIATIAFLVAVIAGAYVSTLFYEINPAMAFWVFTAFLLCVCVVGIPLNYASYERRQKFIPSLHSTVTEGWWVLKHRAMLVIPATGLWAIATVVSIKSIPYSMAKFGVAESTASLVLLCSAIGGIAGNVMTLRVKNRWLMFRIYAYAFAALIALFHVLTTSFTIMVVYSILVGMTMGAATNLVDASYIKFIGDHNVKENGTALYGTILNIILALTLYGLRLVPEDQHFLVMGGIVVLLGIYVRLTLHKIKKEVPLIS